MAYYRLLSTVYTDFQMLRFCLHVTIWLYLQTCLLSQLEKKGYHWWVEGRDTVNPTMPRTAPIYTTINYLTKNVDNDKAEKP